MGLKGVEGMEIPNPVSMFEARHGDNTDVLLALLTQNKELEGKAKLKTLKLEWSGQSPVDIAVIINAVPRSFLDASTIESDLCESVRKSVASDISLRNSSPGVR